VQTPQTRYTLSGEVRIAYQVIGQGPIDLVFVPGFISNLELHWEEPGYSHLLRRLSAFARVIHFDKRGTGLSDRVDPEHPIGADHHAETLPRSSVPTVEE
jgi:pimeloyl-ACP methyl ester carboxylesterase